MSDIKVSFGGVPIVVQLGENTQAALDASSRAVAAAAAATLLFSSTDRAGTIAQRGAIPVGQRTYEMEFHVNDIVPPRTFVWRKDAAGAGLDDWLGLPTPSEQSNLGNATGILKQENAPWVVGGLAGLDSALSNVNTNSIERDGNLQNQVDAIKGDTVAITSLTATPPAVAVGASIPSVVLKRTVSGNVSKQYVEWDQGKYRAYYDPAATDLTVPPALAAPTTALVLGSSLSILGTWVNAAAAAAGLTLKVAALYASSSRKQALRVGAFTTVLSLTGGVLPAAGTAGTVALINGAAPSYSNPDAILHANEGDADPAGHQISGMLAGRHVTIIHRPATAPNVYEISQDAGGAALAIPAGSEFVPDWKADLATAEIWGDWGQNGYDVPEREFANLDAILRLTRGQRIMLSGVLNDASMGTGSAGLAAVKAYNAKFKARYPQFYLEMRLPLLAAGNSTGNDAADRANEIIPRSQRTTGSTVDSLHPGTAGNTTWANVQIAARAALPAPGALTSTSMIALTVYDNISGNADTARVSLGGVTAAQGVKADTALQGNDRAGPQSGVIILLRGDIDTTGTVHEVLGERGGLISSTDKLGNVSKTSPPADLFEGLRAALLPGDTDTGTAFEIITERGRRIQSIDNSGALVVVSSELAVAPAVGLLPGDVDGTPLGAVSEDGRPLAGGTMQGSGLLDARKQVLPSGDAFISGVTPNRQVRLFRGAGIADLIISPLGHDPDAVWQYGETISYRRTTADGTGTAGRRMAFSASPPYLGAGTSRFTLSLVYGQSNSNGGNILTSAVSKTPVRAGRALMFGRGARLNYSTAFRLPFADIGGLRDLFEADETRLLRPGETPCSGFAYALTALVPASETTICNSFGVGSQSIDALKKGTLPYQNLIDAVQAANIMAQAAGFSRIVVPRLLWVQGEADNAKTVAAYQAVLDALQSDLTTDIQAITGQTEQVLFYVPQISSFPNLQSGMATAGQAALNLHIAYPARFRCTGPMYRYPFVDSVHLTGLSTRQHGEDTGRKCARLETAASADTCLFATAAVLTGTTLTVTFAGAEGTLALDTSLVTDPGQYGFQITDDGGSPPTLSAFAVSGSNTLTAVVSAAPGANPKLQVGLGPRSGNGGPTVGPRCCLRDTVAGTRSDGSTRHNYACHQTISIT